MTGALLMGAACDSNHPSSSQASDTRAKTTSTRDIYAGPTAAALAAVAEAHVAASGTDCGGGALDSGWPTTAVPFRPSTCIRDADQAGRRAFMLFSGRTYAGAAYRIVLASDGHGRLRVTVVIGGASGGLRRDAWDCPVPQSPFYLSVTFPDDRVQPSVVDRTCRRLAA